MRGIDRLWRLLGQKRGSLTPRLCPVVDRAGPGLFRLDFDGSSPVGRCRLHWSTPGNLLATRSASDPPVTLRQEGREPGALAFIPPSTEALFWQVFETGPEPPGLRLEALGGLTNLGVLLAERGHRLCAARRGVRLLRLAFSGQRWFEPGFDADHQLIPIADGRWRALGEDARGILRFAGRRIPVGACTLELRVDAEQPVIDTHLYFDDGLGFRETLSQRITLASGTLSRSAVFVPLRTRAIRLDPVSEPGAFSIQRLCIRQRGLSATLAQAGPGRLRSLARRYGGFLPQRLRQRLNALPILAGPETQAYQRYLAGAEPALKEERAAIEAHQAGWVVRPTISILMPTWNTPIALLDKAVESVRAQTWTEWQLCVADDASTHRAVQERLSEWSRRDPRIRFVVAERNGGISAASNAALALASGEFVGFLDHDDELHPLALYYVVEALNRKSDLDLIYTDEDKIDSAGRRFDPHFKPDWNPELLESQNYLAHFSVYRTDRVRELGGLRSVCDGSQDFDLALRVSAICGAERIHHVPVVLYHWRAIPGSTALANDAKAYPHQAGLRALADRHAAEAGVRVDSGLLPTSYRVDPALPEPAPLVSIIIPTRDGGAHLRVCLDSLTGRTHYPAFEVLLVNNQSGDPDTLALFSELEADARFRLLDHDAPFNYSAINNIAAGEARGRVLLLLNDDTEVLAEGWLSELVRIAIQPEVGAVGALLVYPDGSVQHGGVALGIGGVAGHLHSHWSGNSDGYMGRLKLRQAVAAVTAACLAVEREKFLAVGGLDEVNLPIAFNDVDLCLRLAERGWRSVWTPWARLVHHESKSRGLDIAAEKRERFDRESRYMKRRWGAALRQDPYYSPHFTRSGPSYTLTDPPYCLRPWAANPSPELQ